MSNDPIIGGPGGGEWGIRRLIAVIIVVAAMAGILFVALPAMGIMLPQWFIAICVIVLVAIVALIALKILSSFI